MNNHELIMKGDKIYLLDDDAETTSLKKAVGILAMNVYAGMIELNKTSDEQERKRLENKIAFQSKILNSLLNALSAVGTD